MAEDILHEVTQADYKYGFTTDIETDIIPVGLNEDVVRIISAKKNEPEWMLDYRLKAYHQWTKMKMPEWAHLKIPETILSLVLVKPSFNLLKNPIFTPSSCQGH
jgi:Fe-S cluster assembly protein SufB